MNAKRIALLCAVILLFAAPSWAAERMSVGGFTLTLDSNVEGSFDKAIKLETSDGGFVHPEFVKYAEFDGAKVGLFDLFGEQLRLQEWPNGRRVLVSFAPEQYFNCGAAKDQVLERTLNIPDIIWDEGAAIPLGPTTIDLLTFYDRHTAELQGGVSMLRALEDLDVQLANDMFANSGLGQITVRLVGFLDIGYDVDADGGWSIRDDATIHANRQFFGADLVQMVDSDFTSYAGWAFFYCGGDPECGYIIMNGNALGHGTLAHEIGHTLGLDHELAYAQGEGLGLPSFNKSMYVCFGVDDSRNVRGIMSYGAGAECGSTAVRIVKFSGEGLYEQGQPFWNDISKQAQVVQMYAANVAAYYQTASTGPCEPSSSTLCVDGVYGSGDRRFKVELTFSSIQAGGVTGIGKLADFSSPLGGLFYYDYSGRPELVNPKNPEIFVKMLDGCSVNSRSWLYVSGLTSLGFELTVTDTQTNFVRVVPNQDGHPFIPLEDVNAFPCN